MVRLENIKKVYHKTTVIENLNLEVEKGKLVVLIDPRGCGKTTTLKMMNRLRHFIIAFQNISCKYPFYIKKVACYVRHFCGLRYELY